MGARKRARPSPAAPAPARRVVAAVVNGHCDAGDEVTVRLRGGELKITCREDFTVLMEGPASHVFDGVMEIDL